MKKIIILFFSALMALPAACQNKDKTFTVPVYFNAGFYLGGVLYTTIPVGGNMIFPATGIPISTGTAWAASIVNNSANWNTAYSWGNHAGLYRPITWVPTFAQVTNKPTTIAGYGITDAFNGTWTSLTGKPTFATVSTTGNYDDLVNKPIPTRLFIDVLTSAQIAALVPGTDYQAGYLVLNTSDNCLQIWTGTIWKIIISDK